VVNGTVQGRRRAWLGPVAVIVAGALLAACGGGSQSHAASGNRPSTTTTASTTTTTTDPGTLPQTRDEPVANGAQFNAGVNGLWTAVVTDNPAAAMPFFFPLSAYLQVKAISNPAGDWQNRLVAAYTRDIHNLHLSLGSEATQAQLVGIDVPQSQAEWIVPGVEYNKIGYWRVYGTRVRYTVDGQTRSFAVASLISWRGEWYVVHLSSIS
jgi:hypothetical protein